MAILALCFSNETFQEEFVKSYYQFGWSFIVIIDQCGRNPKQCIDSISKKQGVLFSIYSVFLLLFSALRLQVPKILHLLLDLFIGTHFCMLLLLFLMAPFFLIYICYIFVVHTQSTIAFYVLIILPTTLLSSLISSSSLQNHFFSSTIM